MHNHRASCVFNCGTTDELYELEGITDVFDHIIDNRWFLVKWKGYDEIELEREHLRETSVAARYAPIGRRLDNPLAKNSTRAQKANIGAQ